MGKAFGVRGSIEMCDLTFNKVTVGFLDRLRTVVLHLSEVGKKALALQHTAERKYQGLQEHTMIKDTGNPTCIVKLLHHYRDNLCLPKMVTSNQPSFRRLAPEKELKVLCISMIHLFCWYQVPVIFYAYRYIYAYAYLCSNSHASLSFLLLVYLVLRTDAS